MPHTSVKIPVAPANLNYRLCPPAETTLKKMTKEKIKLPMTRWPAGSTAALVPKVYAEDVKAPLSDRAACAPPEGQNLNGTHGSDARVYRAGAVADVSLDARQT